MKIIVFGVRVELYSIFAALAAAVVFEAASLNAQSVTQPLTLADVYRLAEKAPQIDASNALAKAAASRIAGARRLPDPEIQLGLMNRSIPSLAPMDPLGMTQIQLMQVIPAPGKLGLSARIASENAEKAKAQSQEVRWDVRAKAAQSYYDLYASEGQLEIARDTRALVQDIAKVSQAMYSAGDGKQAEVLRAQLEVSRMSEEITRMESMRDAAAGRLRAVLAMNPAEELRTVSIPSLPDSLPTFDALAAEAEQNRPMIAAGERELSGAEASVRLASKEIWPDLQIGVQYGWRGGSEGTERMGSLMIGASLPIYAHSRQLQSRVEAAAMRAAASADLVALRADTRGRVRELYADYTKARNLRTLYTTTILPQATGAVTAAFAAYRAGTVSLSALLESEMTANTYRQELIALTAEQGSAIAQIEALLGRQLFSPTTIARTSR